MDPIGSAVEHFIQMRSGETGLQNGRRSWLILAATALAIAAALLVYSQTMAFVWDEGFHLLTAQLIDDGKKPYIDFCFPQTPLNAYWNAFWMRVFGESWRVSHVFAALEVACAAYLTAGFVFDRFRAAGWRLACALAALFFVGLNTNVVLFATSGQAYAAGLLLIVAAFRVALFAAGRRGIWAASASGLLAGTAAGCTLLTAPVAPVLFIWLLIYNREGGKWSKSAAFALGALVPFAPVFWLFAQAPRQVFFNVVQYQAIFRRVNWEGASVHDADVLSAWLSSSQVLAMGFLGIAGTLFVWKNERTNRGRRSEYLAALWLAVALTGFIATAHPTFERYFLFVVPFLGMLAAVGIYDVALRLTRSERARWPAAVLLTIVALGCARAIFRDRDSTTWYDYQKVARKVAEVTPKNGRLYADELVYFLLHWTPPSGMEFSYAHKLELPADQERLYHIFSEREAGDKVKRGEFATVQSCNDDAMDRLKLDDFYAHKADFDDCSVYWGYVQPKGSGTNRK